MRFSKLQDDNKKAKKLRSEKLLEGWKNIKEVLYDQGFLYVSKTIRSELISRHYNNLFINHFGKEKTWELIAKKYYWSILWSDIEAYVKDCDICLALKAVCHKLYRNLQLLSILTLQWKNLSIDFITSLSISANWKGDSYKSKLVIIDQLIKMVYYEPVKVTIDTPDLAKVIINMVVHHHRVSDWIVIDSDLLYISKF